jgi:starch synthase (maltosyl-transferring)
VLLTRVRQYVRTGSETREAGAAAVTAFTLLSLTSARWLFSQQGLRWRVTLELGTGNAVRLTWEMENHPGTDAQFFLRPDIECRSFHAVTEAAQEKEFPQSVRPQQAAFTFALPGRLPLRMAMPGAAFQVEPEWHLRQWLPQEAERGLPDRTDLFSPGVFRWEPRAAGARLAAVAEAGGDTFEPSANAPLPAALPEAMTHALQLYLASRDGEWTVIAGFPWFLDWGRDSLIFCRGLIAAGELEKAAAIVRRFAAWESHGSIPNLLRGRDASNRETSDAPLWLVTVIKELAAVRLQTLTETAGGRPLSEIVCNLVQAHLDGAEHGVIFDRASGLLWSPSHFTWMDTADPAGTPREGYPVSIQCLWAAALDFAHHLDASRGWAMLAAQVRESIRTLFWRGQFLSDCLHAPRGTAAVQAVADDHVRPNQLLAITLGAMPETAAAQHILQSCEDLLVPGALRTLAPRPVVYPLPVEWDGHAAHDPHQPYHGRYTGPENVSRKAAYHNGTAWPWLLPTFCEALVKVHGPSAIPQARRLMGTTSALLQDGCLGQLAEVMDGDPPHRLRGCGAQAWSISEWVRVWRLLQLQAAAVT